MKTSKTINGQRINASKTIQNFLNYDYKGNGKYYTTEQGSRHYRNTAFQNFYNSNSECVDIIAYGNDAPRGGQTGSYVEVKFNEEFTNKWGWFLEELKKAADLVAAYKAEKQRKIDEIGDQKQLLRDYFLAHPEFLVKIKNRIENYSSKQWRNWSRMKVAQKITNESFEYFTLTPPEIREIAYSI